MKTYYFITFLNKCVCVHVSVKEFNWAWSSFNLCVGGVGVSACIYGGERSIFIRCYPLCLIFFLGVCTYVCVCIPMHTGSAVEHMWRLEDNLWWPVLCVFHDWLRLLGLAASVYLLSPCQPSAICYSSSVSAVIVSWLMLVFLFILILSKFMLASWMTHKPLEFGSQTLICIIKMFVNGAGEAVQCKSACSKPDTLNSSPSPVKQRTIFQTCPLTTCAPWHMHGHPHTIIIIKHI